MVRGTEDPAGDDALRAMPSAPTPPVAYTSAQAPWLLSELVLTYSLAEVESFEVMPLEEVAQLRHKQTWLLAQLRELKTRADLEKKMRGAAQRVHDSYLVPMSPQRAPSRAAASVWESPSKAAAPGSPQKPARAQSKPLPLTPSKRIGMGPNAALTPSSHYSDSAQSVDSGAVAATPRSARADVETAIARADYVAQQQQELLTELHSVKERILQHHLAVLREAIADDDASPWRRPQLRRATMYKTMRAARRPPAVGPAGTGAPLVVDVTGADASLHERLRDISAWREQPTVDAVDTSRSMYDDESPPAGKGSAGPDPAPTAAGAASPSQSRGMDDESLDASLSLDSVDESVAALMQGLEKLRARRQGLLSKLSNTAAHQQSLRKRLSRLCHEHEELVGLLSLRDMDLDGARAEPSAAPGTEADALQALRLEYEAQLGERDEALRAALSAAQAGEAAMRADAEAARNAALAARTELSATEAMLASLAWELDAAREALAEGRDGASAERDAAPKSAQPLMAEKDAAPTAAQQLMAECDKAKAALQQLTAERDETKAALQQLTAERDETKAALQQLTTERDEAQTALQQLTTERDETKAALQQLTTERDETKAALQQLTAERDEAQEALQQLTTERDEATTFLQQLTTERDEARTALQQLTTERDETKAALQQLTTERDEAQSAYAALASERDDAHATAERLTSERDDAQAALEQIMTVHAESRESLAQLSSEHAKALADAHAEHAATRAQLADMTAARDAAHAEAQSSVEAAHAKELADAHDEHSEALTRAHDEHTRALAALRDDVRRWEDMHSAQRRVLEEAQARLAAEEAAAVQHTVVPAPVPEAGAAARDVDAAPASSAPADATARAADVAGPGDAPASDTSASDASVVVYGDGTPEHARGSDGTSPLPASAAAESPTRSSQRPASPRPPTISKRLHRLVSGDDAPGAKVDVLGLVWSKSGSRRAVSDGTQPSHAAAAAAHDGDDETDQHAAAAARAPPDWHDQLEAERRKNAALAQRLEETTELYRAAVEAHSSTTTRATTPYTPLALPGALPPTPRDSKALPVITSAPTPVLTSAPLPPRPDADSARPSEAHAAAAVAADPSSHAVVVTGPAAPHVAGEDAGAEAEAEAKTKAEASGDAAQREQPSVADEPRREPGDARDAADTQALQDVPATADLAASVKAAVPAEDAPSAEAAAPTADAPTGSAMRPAAQVLEAAGAPPAAEAPAKARAMPPPISTQPQGHAEPGSTSPTDSVPHTPATFVSPVKEWPDTPRRAPRPSEPFLSAASETPTHARTARTEARQRYLEMEAERLRRAAEQSRHAYDELQASYEADMRERAKDRELVTAWRAEWARLCARLEQQHHFCERVLGKADGREEMDGLLDQIKASLGAHRSPTPARDPVEEAAQLLLQVEEHIGDMAEGLARAGASGLGGNVIAQLEDRIEELEEQLAAKDASAADASGLGLSRGARLPLEFDAVLCAVVLLSALLPPRDELVHSMSLPLPALERMLAPPAESTSALERVRMMPAMDTACQLLWQTSAARQRSGGAAFAARVDHALQRLDDVLVADAVQSLLADVLARVASMLDTSQQVTERAIELEASVQQYAASVPPTPEIDAENEKPPLWPPQDAT